MTETVMEKEQYCHHRHSEFQHTTLLNTKDKDIYPYRSFQHCLGPQTHKGHS